MVSNLIIYSTKHNRYSGHYLPKFNSLIPPKTPVFLYKISLFTFKCKMADLERGFLWPKWVRPRWDCYLMLACAARTGEGSSLTWPLMHNCTRQYSAWLEHIFDAWTTHRQSLLNKVELKLNYSWQNHYVPSRQFWDCGRWKSELLWNFTIVGCSQSQQTWSGFSPTTVPDNNRQSRFSPTTVPKLSTGMNCQLSAGFFFTVDEVLAVPLVRVPSRQLTVHWQPTMLKFHKESDFYLPQSQNCLLGYEKDFLLLAVLNFMDSPQDLLRCLEYIFRSNFQGKIHFEYTQK